MKNLVLPVLGSLAACSCVDSAWSQSFQLDPLWSVPAGSQTYVTSAAAPTERGLAFDSVSGEVLLVSRNATEGLAVHRLNASTGANLGTLDVSGISGGTFSLSSIGVAGDGAIYAANLVTSSATGTPFKVYRWANAAAAPTVAYSGDTSTGQRFGDSMAVSGSGLNTQLAFGFSGNATSVRAAVFSTADGSSFTSTTLSPSGVNAGAMQRGISFGETAGTLVGKQTSVAGQVISYTLGGVSTLLTTSGLDPNIGPIAVDPVHHLLAGIDDTTHSVLLYDFTDPSKPTLLSTASMPTPHNAGNGTGALDFGNGVLYALEANNGVAAFTLTSVPEPGEFGLAAGLGLVALAAYRSRQTSKR